MARDIWGEKADVFVGRHYDGLQGQVRLAVLHRQLKEHLPDSPAEIVDVGAGGGNLAISLAEGGHRVTMVEPSPGMQEVAKAAVASLNHEVAARIELVDADAAGAPDRLGRSFDVVLCHGVVMYVDRDPLLDSLAALASHGGLVSIMAKSRPGLVTAAALQQRWGDALEAFDAEGEVNRLGLTTRADTVEEITDEMTDRGVSAIAWYGVRLYSEWVADDVPLEHALVDLEFEASKRDPYRLLSRLFHWVGRKA